MSQVNVYNSNREMVTIFDDEVNRAIWAKKGFLPKVETPPPPSAPKQEAPAPQPEAPKPPVSIEVPEAATAFAIKKPDEKAPEQISTSTLEKKNGRKKKR